jgi:hypothetical protein
MLALLLLVSLGASCSKTTTTTLYCLASHSSDADACSAGLASHRQAVDLKRVDFADDLGLFSVISSHFPEISGSGSTPHAVLSRGGMLALCPQAKSSHLEEREIESCVSEMGRLAWVPGDLSSTFNRVWALAIDAHGNDARIIEKIAEFLGVGPALAVMVLPTLALFLAVLLVLPCIFCLTPAIDEKRAPPKETVVPIAIDPSNPQLASTATSRNQTTAAQKRK